ncbi:MAG: UDP-N-acetylglucosamine--N-acetylmuramyl-(pentapeptide) pyrophosphoryl-undecaprenol N-acetylglucosamine transferase [Dehalococcoidia bacterium]
MKVGLAGGGTGGHAYPAIAVAEELRASPDVELVYFGTERGPERAVAEEHSIPYRTVPASPLRSRSPIRLLRGTFDLFRGSAEAGHTLRHEAPDCVFATGGYAAAPLGRPAKAQHIPLLLFLPDVKPGWAVRYLQRYATSVACSVDASLRYLSASKTAVTGYPVRRQFAEATREEGVRRFNLDPGLLTLLVAGGSLGSHAINGVLAKCLRELLTRAQIIHIAGRDEELWLSKERERLPEWQQERYHLYAYTGEMAWAMAAADLAVTRAGASVLGELPATRLPAVLIPGDFSDQHLNAAYLVERGAAVALSMRQIEDLEATIVRLLDNDLERRAMGRAMAELARPDAARTLAMLLREMAA